MKISQPFLYTGMNKQNLKIEVYIIDEVNDRDIYVKTVEVETELATFELRTKTKELKDIFQKVTDNLYKNDGVKIISKIVNGARLEQIGEFEQHGNVFTLKFKIKC